jgi:hypothetical protein
MGVVRIFPYQADRAPAAHPILPIPVDNKAVIKNLLQPITDQTLTFHLLSSDYDILQAIRSTIDALPVTNIFHVKSHQDLIKPFEELTPNAQINILADCQANAIYTKCPHHTGLFPTWIPGTHAALFHGPHHQVATRIPNYVRTATHAPHLKDYLICQSHEATGCDTKWDDATFDAEFIAGSPLANPSGNSPLANALNSPNT